MFHVLRLSESCKALDARDAVRVVRSRGRAVSAIHRDSGSGELVSTTGVPPVQCSAGTAEKGRSHLKDGCSRNLRTAR
jgi:hypothetical protein